METIVLLEATLDDYSPCITVQNPFKPTQKRWLAAIAPAKAATARKTVGKVQLIRRTSSTSTPGSGSHEHTTYWLRFEGVSIRNDRDLLLYVLLSRANDAALDDERSVQQLETRAQPVLLDIGPEGQWKGSHLPPIFEQEVLIFDPMVFASIAIGKPAVAKPPTAQMLVFAYGAFQTYVPPTKSPEQIALEMEALSTRLLQTVMEMEQDQLQSDDELSLDALQRNAHQLFRMFDQDRSDSIDFEEYKQMLVYRKLNLLESKAKRFFELVDDQKNELQKRNVEGFSGVIAQKKGKRGVKEMQNALLDAIHQEEQNELRAALQAKEEVVRMEKQRRDAEQEETRRLFQQQRHAATSTRTKEALRERQEKMDRKKERTIKDRQSREERRLLERAEAEAEKRVIHEREVVQELMATKMERIIRHKARCGDDVMDLLTTS
ncbi:hypothetical protein BBJ29_004753 [Phytophthora kernoviae]|uniref:EF-hand domain-containing protein n=1 Tax=Phytophthora kernoviae TaxID=325452 RepID=A0A3F2RYR1_9STRA|nr:hypothetical protein BBJ29_004753 [Phytophthora kernoviae]RLN66843.1 hypothetical protein BBP00_00002008 [Phytophthora kernoviae]